LLLNNLKSDCTLHQAMNDTSNHLLLLQGSASDANDGATPANPDMQGYAVRLSSEFSLALFTHAEDQCKGFLIHLGIGRLLLVLLLL